jgi:hypothetical protein
MKIAFLSGAADGHSKTCERVGLEEELAAQYLSGTAGRKIKSGSGTWTR